MPTDGTPAIQDSDERLVNRLTHFAIEELGDAWGDFADNFHNLRQAVSLAAPWSVYDFEVDGRTAVEAYLDRHGRRCTPEERTWLNAQRAAWLSVWEVLAVDPGKTVTLRDLLSDERRTVLGKRGFVDPGLAMRCSAAWSTTTDLGPLRHASARAAPWRRVRARAARQGTTQLHGGRADRPPQGTPPSDAT